MIKIPGIDHIKDLETESYNQVSYRFHKEFYNTINDDSHSKLIGQILQGHLILEHLLINFIEASHVGLKDVKNLQFGYSKLLKIFKSILINDLRHGVEDKGHFKVVFETMADINRLRNCLAHQGKESVEKDRIINKIILLAKKKNHKFDQDLEAVVAEIASCSGFVFWSIHMAAKFNEIEKHKSDGFDEILRNRKATET